VKYPNLDRLNLWFENLGNLIRFPGLSPDVGKRSKRRFRRAAWSGLTAVLSRMVWIITLLISVPLTVNYLGRERYGMWMTMSALIALLQFADLGIGYGLLNSVSEASGKDDVTSARKYISSGFYYLLAIAVMLGLGFVVIYPIIPWGVVYNVSSSEALAEAAPATGLFALLFLASIPLSVVSRVQQGYQEGYIDSLWQAVGRIAGLIFLLTVVWLRLGLPWLVLALAGSPIFAQSANFLTYFYIKKPSIKPSLTQFNQLAAGSVLRIGFLFFLLQLVIAVAFASDTVILAQIIGPEAVAVFTVAYQIFLFVPALIRVMLTPLWPAYGEATSRGDRQWAERTFNYSIRASLLVTGLVAVFLALFGSQLIAIWAGPAVVPPTILLIALGFNSIILNGWGDPVAMFLNGTGKVVFEVSWAIPMAIANVGLSIFLTRNFGISGVAWGTSISYFLLMVIPTTIYLRRVLVPASDSLKT